MFEKEALNSQSADFDKEKWNAVEEAYKSASKYLMIRGSAAGVGGSGASDGCAGCRSCGICMGRTRTTTPPVPALRQSVRSTQKRGELIAETCVAMALVGTGSGKTVDCNGKIQ